MKWVFYSSLNAKAKRAYNKGNGKRNGFIINNGHIASIDNEGRAKDFIKVIKCKGKVIKGIPVK